MNGVRTIVACMILTITVSGCTPRQDSSPAPYRTPQLHLDPDPSSTIVWHS